MHTGCTKLDTHVLIIGNGPSGIALSSFLSGMHPFYNVGKPHSNKFIHEKLLLNSNLSLLDQDLTWSDKLNEISQTGRSISILYDMLVRPGADKGIDIDGSLLWEMNRAREVPHIVIGDGDVGGSWNEYDPEMRSVSMYDWLDMPGYSIKQWLGGVPLLKRLPTLAITEYLHRYIEHIGNSDKFMTYVKVSSVEKMCNGEWLTIATNSEGRRVVIRSKAVVIACGKTSPKKLNKCVRMDDQNTVYDLRSLKHRLDKLQCVDDIGIPSTSKSTVLVVGDGISSVDCVRECLDRKTKVVHVIRRSAKELRGISMSRLSPEDYEEYTNIYRLMIGREKNPYYTRILEANINEVDEDQVKISAAGRQMEINYSILAICIGRESSFDQVLNDATLKEFQDYRCTSDSSLFAAGAFIGDHFVRYLIGGCLRVAQHILKCSKLCNNNNNNNNNNNSNENLADRLLFE